MSEFFTHEGELRSTEWNLPLGTRVPVKLRQLKVLWVDEYDRRYRKTDGVMTGTLTPIYRLHTTTIRKLVPDVVKVPEIEDVPQPEILMEVPEVGDGA
jgi:hypothetical protein